MRPIRKVEAELDTTILSLNERSARVETKKMLQNLAKILKTQKKEIEVEFTQLNKVEFIGQKEICIKLNVDRLGNIKIYDL